VPSGVRPRRRLCDAAVDAFAARLKPELGSPLTPSRRYPPEQIAKAREAILNFCPVESVKRPGLHVEKAYALREPAEIENFTQRGSIFRDAFAAGNA
jgi:hypothetical protein